MISKAGIVIDYSVSILAPTTQKKSTFRMTCSPGVPDLRLVQTAPSHAPLQQPVSPPPLTCGVPYRPREAVVQGVGSLPLARAGQGQTGAAGAAVLRARGAVSVCVWW